MADAELFHYPYRFVQRQDESWSSDSFLKYKLLYAFRSPKSHQWYWVWVEVYDHHLYAVKFHLKAHRHSRDKYSLLTGLNEARSVINTCVAIMREIGNFNPHSSFGFIGANMKSETPYFTKRFRVYSRMMATYFSEDVFEHYMLISKSAYLMIRKSELERQPELPEIFTARFKKCYDYFD